MKALFVSPYPPTRDGIGTYAAVLAGGLADAGAEVRVVAARPAREASPPEVIGVLPPPGRGRVAEAVGGFAPDVAHVQFAIAGYAGRLPLLLRFVGQLRALGVPVVATMHEVTRDTDSLGAPGQALYRLVAARCDAVIVHTEQAAVALRGIVGDDAYPVHVIPHFRAELPPAETTAAALRDRIGAGDEPVLLSFGYIDVDKGLEDLIAALAQLRDRPWRLVVAGTVRRRYGIFRPFELRDRRLLGRVEQLVRDLGLADRVTFAGYVPSGEIAPWFALADAAVLPYRRSEQSGVANLAASAGAPILASDVGGLTALAADTFPPHDPEALAACLAHFLDGDRGPAPAPVQDLPAIIAAHLDVYEAHSDTADKHP